MSQLRTRLTEDMKNFLRAKDEIALNTVRNVISELKKREIDQKLTIDDAAVMTVIGALIKSRRESVDQYTKGGRQDLADRELKEIKVLEAYMPAQMSDDELSQIIKTVIKETGAVAPKDQGNVMKAIMPKLQGRAEGARVKDLVAKLLGSTQTG